MHVHVQGKYHEFKVESHDTFSDNDIYPIIVG